MIKSIITATIAASALLAGSYYPEAKAYEYSTITPTYGGGSRVTTYGSGGASYSTITPTYGGGASIRTHGSNGSSYGTITPTYGGGYSGSSYSF